MGVTLTPEAFILAIVLVLTPQELGDEDAGDVREPTATCVTSGDCDVYYMPRPLIRNRGST